MTDEGITRVRQIEAALEALANQTGAPQSVSVSGPPWNMPDDDPRLVRKQRSEIVLRVERIAFAEHMPPIEGEQQVRLRSLEAVYQRAATLFTLSLFSRGNTEHRWPTLEQLSALGALEQASEHEREFLEGAREFSEQEQTNAWWLLDAAVALLWALGADVELGFPRGGARLSTIGPLMPPFPELPEVYPELRPLSEILDQVDLTYRLHWASKPNRDGSPRCEWLSHSALIERHKAFNWLIGYRGYATWDEVTTDT